MEDGNKTTRVLNIYNKFKNGEVVYKEYGVNERTIQRNIGDIR